MVNTRVRAYLAHTFKHRKFVKDVLTPKLNAIGIETRNPFYENDGSTKRKEVALADRCDIQGIKNHISMKKKKDRDKWIRAVRFNNKKIVVRDLGYVNRTDLTIAYMTDISAGTTCEIFYTGIIKHRPVFLLTDNPEVSEHPWIVYSCRQGKICKTVDELIKALKRKYG
jgi:hypothetical protein